MIELKGLPQVMKVDERRRVAIPAEYRSHYMDKNPARELYQVLEDDGCVGLYVPSQYSAHWRRVSKEPAHNKERIRFLYVLLSNIDRQGRIILHPTLSKLERIVVAPALDHLELWAPKMFPHKKYL